MESINSENKIQISFRKIPSLKKGRNSNYSSVNNYSDNKYVNNPRKKGQFRNYQSHQRRKRNNEVYIYGENKGDTDKFDESYLGYINCNTSRAGYPESKRLCEALCQSYISQYDMDIVIGRLSRVYGPTMADDDSKALAQFMRNALNNEDIVLKSEGNQLYSYLYVSDVVSAMLFLINYGKSGEAYNISDKKLNNNLWQN